MSEPQAALEKLIAGFRRRRPLRAGSLIVTAFGDMIAPRGGAVLLGDLAPVLEKFGINDSQARTALSRLVGDGWLASQRLGRRSLYRLTRIGSHRFAEATRRIYFGAPRAWDGSWCVALLAPVADKARPALRRDLHWLGFGALTPETLIHPRPDRVSLASVIADLPVAARPLLVEGADLGRPSDSRLRAMARQCWDLDSLERFYAGFVRQFGPLERALTRGPLPAPLDGALARILLIHEYRRIILRDPLLPATLIDAGWSGAIAHALARDIYRRVAPAGERWIDGHLHDARGPLPAPDAAFHSRFK